MSISLSAFRATTAAMLLFLALGLVAVGCSSGSSDTTTTGASITGSTGSSVVTSEDATTTTLPVAISDYDKELAKTATIQHALAVYLTEQQASSDDPRMAIIYGLRARTQALTARKAVDKGDFALADTAMKDVYSTLNLGRGVAAGNMATILSEAKAAVETLGAPSDRPTEAAAILDAFIAALAPLMAEATAITPSTTTST